MKHENLTWLAMVAIVAIGLALGGCSSSPNPWDTAGYKHGYDLEADQRHYVERCEEKFDNRKRLRCLEAD